MILMCGRGELWVSSFASQIIRRAMKQKTRKGRSAPGFEDSHDFDVRAERIVRGELWVS